MIKMGRGLLKIDSILIENYFDTVKQFENVTIYNSDLNQIAERLFNFKFDNENPEENPINIIIAKIVLVNETYNDILENYGKNLTTKQYFEIIPWAANYSQIIINYKFITKLGTSIFNALGTNTKLKSAIQAKHIYSPFLKYCTNKTKGDFVFYAFFEEFLNTNEIRDYLGYVKDYKLDFTGSGQILISILINDASFLDFSGVHKNNQNDGNNIGGYDKVLQIFKQKYENDPDYATINKFLEFIEEPGLKKHIKDLIFSRSLVKNDLMVKGYSGTLYGSAKKIENRIKDALLYNGYPFYRDKFLVANFLKKMSNKIAKELNTIIEQVCPAISESYLKLINTIANDIKIKNNDKGAKIPNKITTYSINPKKREVSEITLRYIDLKNKKLRRSSRRKVSYYTPDTDYEKIKSSLGADIIQGFDAVVAFYIKRIVQILNPKLRIATIFDAFIFSQHITPETFKDVCRLACQLAFKSNFVEDLLKANDLASNEFYQKFNVTIFSELKHNVLEKIIESNFLTYLLRHQSRWFTGSTNEINYNFFIKSMQFFNKEEQDKYNVFIADIVQKDPVIIKHSQITDISISKLKDSTYSFKPTKDHDVLKDVANLFAIYNVKFVLAELYKTIDTLHSNFFVINKDSVISQLRGIMNSDDFIK